LRGHEFKEGETLKLLIRTRFMLHAGARQVTRFRMRDRRRDYRSYYQHTHGSTAMTSPAIWNYC